MRHTATGLNHVWLTIVGLLLLLAGLAGVAIGAGWWQPAASAVGLGQLPPGPSDPVAPAGTEGALGLVWVVVIIAVVGLLVGLAGLRWLIAQVPRRHEAKPFRLHDDPSTGLTRCTPSVLTAAVEAQITELSGVQRASAVLRGTAQQPDLTVRVTASDRTDLPRLVSVLRDRVAADLGQALDTRVRRLGVQVEIDTAKAPAGQITR